MPWASGPVILDPPAGLLLVETPCLGRRPVYFSVALSANPPGLSVVFARVSHQGVIKQQKILLVASADFRLDPGIAIEVDEHDRLELRVREAYVGEVEASIFYDVARPSV